MLAYANNTAMAYYEAASFMGLNVLYLGTATALPGYKYWSNYIITGRCRPKSSWASGFQRTWTSWYDRKVPMPFKDEGLMLHEAHVNQPIIDKFQFVKYGDVSIGDATL